MTLLDFFQCHCKKDTIRCSKQGEQSTLLVEYFGLIGRLTCHRYMSIHVILKAVIGVGSKRWTVNLYLVIYAIYTEMKSGVIKL